MLENPSTEVGLCSHGLTREMLGDRWLLVALFPEYVAAGFGDSLFSLLSNGLRRCSSYIDFCMEKRLEKIHWMEGQKTTNPLM